MKLEILSFRDRFDILSEKRPSGVAEQGYTMLYGNPRMIREILKDRKIYLLNLLCLMALMVCEASATEYHVSINGSDNNGGSVSEPFKTISAAADIAQAGDFITVHEGTYRERITPPRGGSFDAMRIVYQAAEGQTVQIKGSEIITNWKQIQDGVWKVTLPNTFF